MTLGPEHISTLASLEGLVFVYRRQKRLKEFEDLEMELLKAKMKVHGLQSLASDDMKHIGLMFLKRRRYEEAVHFMRHQAEFQAASRGLEHLDTLTTTNNLAMVLADLGELVDAEELATRVLANWRNALGPEHSRPLKGIYSLA